MIQTIAKIAGAIICILSILTYGFGANIIPMNTLFTGYLLVNVVLLTMQVSLYGFSSFKEIK